MSDSEEETDAQNQSFEDVRHKNKFRTSDSRTFYSPLMKKSKEGEKDPLFVEAVLKLRGFLEDEKNQTSGSWICTCRAVGTNLDIVTRTIAISYSAFQSVPKFTRELQAGFGNGLIVNGGARNSDLTDYLMFLKDEYKVPKKFMAANHIGYMGDKYWFLSPELQIKKNRILHGNEYTYMIRGERSKFESLFLHMKEELLKKETCRSINAKLVKYTEDFEINKSAVQFAISFALSRLMRLVTSRKSIDQQETGEANMILLFGKKNIGKSFTQQILHYGQGGDSLSHDLIISGGNSITSGSSTMSTQEICKKTSMILNINDTRNTESQAESLLHIHEKLRQGSEKRGMASSRCCGIVMSSNFKEPARLKGRVIRVEYFKKAITEESKQRLDKMKNLCQDNPGFLVAWVINNAEIWEMFAEKGIKTICMILKRCLERQQPRWCEAMALALYTKMTYLSCLGLPCNIADDVTQCISSQPMDSFEPKDVMERLEEDIARKMKESQDHVFTWLNLNTMVKLKDSKRFSRAIAIKASVFREEFIDIRKEDFETELNNVTENAVNCTLFFGKPGTACTLENIKSRDKELVEAKKGYKVLLSGFSTEFQNWIHKGDYEADFENAEEIKKEINVEEKEKLQDLQEEFASAVDETLQGSASSESDDDNSELLTLISPETKKKYNRWTPRRQSCFTKGMLYISKKIQEEEESTNARQPEDDNCEPQPLLTTQTSGAGTKRQLFPPGVFGALPCDKPVAKHACADEPEPSCSTKQPSAIPVAKHACTDEPEPSCSTKQPSAIPVAKDACADEPEPSCSTKQPSAKPVAKHECADEPAPSCSIKKPSDSFTIISKKVEEKNIYCRCKKNQPGKMIECSGAEKYKSICPGNGWYHMKCVKMKKAPPADQQWFCADCIFEKQMKRPVGKSRT